MNVQESYKKLTEKFPERIVLSCYEYESCFVFQVVDKKYADVENANEVLDSLFSVDKKTGEIAAFKPFNIPADEYKRGKRIRIYDHT